MTDIYFFTFNFQPICWCLIGVAILCGVLVWWLIAPFRRTAATSVYVPTEAPSTTSHPALTVIVYASNHLDELDAYLEKLMHQDYDNFDVVLVYDSGASATAAVSEHYNALYENLYFTFIPPESHHLSRQKLAVTLGVKAAKGDVVLTTDTDYTIPSDSWLSEMMDPFTRDYSTEVVLGFTRYDFRELSGASRWYRQFDAVLTSAMWLGYAIGGRPYRGDGSNLAFMKRLFFEQKGFARTLTLQTGYDDVFVNDITSSDNTAVMLNPDSVLTAYWNGDASRMWTDRKERADFSARWLPSGPFLRTGAISAMQWGVAGCCVAAAVIGLPSLIPAIIALIVLLTFWIYEIILYRKVAARLQAVRLCLSLPFFWLWHPVGNLLFRWRHRPDRFKNYAF
ncbi:MAG: glycosyltransferase [Muribaculaceae bacterium]|nr:glycosyltransferase [Muribaculaceae bacterium]